MFKYYAWFAYLVVTHSWYSVRIFCHQYLFSWRSLGKSLGINKATIYWKNTYEASLKNPIASNQKIMKNKPTQKSSIIEVDQIKKGKKWFVLKKESIYDDFESKFTYHIISCSRMKIYLKVKIGVWASKWVGNHKWTTYAKMWRWMNHVYKTW